MRTAATARGHRPPPPARRTSVAAPSRRRAPRRERRRWTASATAADVPRSRGLTPVATARPEERLLEVVDRLDAHVLESLRLELHPLELPEQVADGNRPLLLAPLHFAQDRASHSPRVVGERAGEVVRAADRH